MDGGEVARKGRIQPIALIALLPVWISVVNARNPEQFHWLLLFFGGLFALSVTLWCRTLSKYQKRTPLVRIMGGQLEFYGQKPSEQRIFPMDGITHVALASTPSFIHGAHTLTVVSSSDVTTMWVRPGRPSVIPNVRNLLASQLGARFFDAE